MEDQESFANLLAQQDQISSQIQVGQKVEGKIIAISGDDVFVDIGAKQDGVMDRTELRTASGAEHEIGDIISAFVTGISSQGIKLSRSMSGSGIGALEDAMENGIPVEGRVEGPCKGGYQVAIMGKKAFCPGSQMDGNGDEIAGSIKEFLITRIENHGRNIVVSRRALLEREAAANLENLLKHTRPGDIVKVRVSRIAPFGAFVELAPYVEGMIHISELSWSRIEKPEDAVELNETIEAKILGIETDEKGKTRISMSRKQALNDPWADISEKLHIGDIANGKVTRLVPFGAFVEILPGVEGLVHISEISWEKRIGKPEEILAPGQNVAVKIREINPNEKRISLSIKDAVEDPWHNADENFPVGKVVEGEIENRSPYGFFVKLAPGITGLLPLSEISNAPKSQELDKLAPGDKRLFAIQKLDTSARRISLKTVDPDKLNEAKEKSWHDQPDKGGMGIMAQALQNAMKKRKQQES